LCIRKREQILIPGYTVLQTIATTFSCVKNQVNVIIAIRRYSQGDVPCGISGVNKFKTYRIPQINIGIKIISVKINTNRISSEIRNVRKFQVSTVKKTYFFLYRVREKTVLCTGIENLQGFENGETFKKK
jgi:hypothetical protein